MQVMRKGELKKVDNLRKAFPQSRMHRNGRKAIFRHFGRCRLDYARLSNP